MKMMMMLMKLLLLLGLSVTYAAAVTGSCVGRCGEPFTRGQECNCDSSCLQHNECCPDFQSVCTSGQSCQGRCGEAFRRGQMCECDPQCIYFNTCCPDYRQRCDVSAPKTLRAAASGKRKLDRSRKKSNSESEEWYTALTDNPVGSQPISSARDAVADLPASGSFLPSYGAPTPGSSAFVGPSGPGAGVKKLPSSGWEAPSGPSQGLRDPVGSWPSILQDTAQGLGLSMAELGSDGPGGLLDDVNLCSDSPINGLTALSNGTMLIFKGQLFWSVDPVSRSVGQPQSITDTLGVPSPIDTVFTRCNCHGNVYIIKGDQVWRLDGNLMMEPGYPKPLAMEFPGLMGSIGAALATPATRSRPEAVYFFKNGDIMQRFTFPAGNTPSCSKKPSPPLMRLARQAEVLLSGEINLKVSLQGFPTPVTSALSMPSPQSSGQYQLYIFSGPLFFKVEISGNMPALVKPDPSADSKPQPIHSPAAMATNFANMVAQNADAPIPAPANSIYVWLRCQ
ncbi:uncharacterized protein V6R79_017778 [Siganus canaliculatus]